jgi:pimeloyl-ACP methyl ester carboxylesterase
MDATSPGSVSDAAQSAGAVAERGLDLAGISTRVLAGGSGAAMVFVSGPGERTSRWSQVLPELARTHQVVAPCLPLSACRDPETVELGSECIHAWLGDLIDRTCARPPVLVGAGRGGALAARYAAAGPAGRLDQLVLVGSLGPAPFQPAADFWAELYQFLRTRDHVVEPGRQQTRAEMHSVGECLDEQWTAFQAEDADRGWQQRAMTALGVVIDKLGGPPVVPDELAGIAVPTSLIWGRDDRTTPLAVAEAASTRYDWPLHVIDECGDNPALERPHTFVHVLRTVAGRTRSASRATTPAIPATSHEAPEARRGS